MGKLQIVGYIRSLLSLGLAGELVIPELIGTLGSVISHKQATFIWIDSQCCVTNVYDTAFWDIPPLSEPRMPDCTSGLINSKDDFFHSYCYKTLLEMIATGEAIQSIARGDGGRALGVLFLIREPGDKPFSLQEQELLIGLDTYIASCLQSGATDYTGVWTPTNERGMLLLTLGGKVQECSDVAHKLLMMASHPHLDYRDVAINQVSDSVSALLVRLCNHKITYGAQPMVEDCSNGWGEYEFSAHNLPDTYAKDTNLCGVMVMRREPIILAQWRRSMQLVLLPTQLETYRHLPDGLGRTGGNPTSWYQPPLCNRPYTQD